MSEYAQNSYLMTIKHDFQGLSFLTRYTHVKDPVVSEGQYVSACQKIAESFGDPDVDPDSRRPHIEFDIFPKDPTGHFNSLITKENWRHILDAMSYCD